MNILLLTMGFPPEIGSIAHLFHELSENLTRKGHKVTVVTGFPRYNVKEMPEKYKGKVFLKEYFDGIRVIRINTIPVYSRIPIVRGLDHFLISLAYLIAGAISGNQDVILAYSPPLPLGLSGYILRLMKRAPFVFNVQDIFPQCAIDLGVLKNPFLIWIFEKIEKFIYEKANYITVHSDGNRDFLVFSKGAAAHKVVVVHNWVDTDLIQPSERLNDFREENNLGAKFVVSFAGTMGFSQDLGTVIEAANLLKSYDDILFLLVGDGVEKPKLEAKAKQLNLNNVAFLPMQLKEKYPSVLAASDVSLVTLKKDVVTPVVPSKLISIMASGRPVIGSLNPDGDAAKIIEDAKCGLVVEPENPEDLSQAVLKLYSNPSLSQTFGKNGRQYAEEHFSRHICIQKYESLFERSANELQRILQW